MTYDELYSQCYEAWQWAESGDYKAGSNHWMIMFVDKLSEKVAIDKEAD